MSKRNTVGVIGAGSFGTAMANLLGLNTDVLIYSRNPDTVDQINRREKHYGVVPRERGTTP